MFFPFSWYFYASRVKFTEIEQSETYFDCTELAVKGNVHGKARCTLDQRRIARSVRISLFIETSIESLELGQQIPAV